MNSPAADRIGILALSVLMVIAFAFGGGGSVYGLANLLVQLAALAVLAMRGGSAIRFWRESPLLLRIPIVLALLLPLLQIVPLPETVWLALPGHDLVARSFEAAGTGGWMTWSVDPLRSALALSALITPLAVVVAGWSLPRHHLLTLGWLVVALGLVTTLMGLVQPIRQVTTSRSTRHVNREPSWSEPSQIAIRPRCFSDFASPLPASCLLPDPIQPYPGCAWGWPRCCWWRSF